MPLALVVTFLMTAFVVGALPSVAFESTVKAHVDVEHPATRPLVLPPGTAGSLLAPARAEASTPTTSTFRAIGASWRGPRADGLVRVRHDGQWSEWQSLEVDPDEGPDQSSAEFRAGPHTSAMVWIGAGDAYEVQIPDTATDLSVLLVREQTVRHAVTRGAQPADAAVALNGPGVHLREEWGARPPTHTDYATTVRRSYVHHTVNSNSYAPGDVPAMIQAIQAYHMDANGWSDIGYNFLVDKFGGIWEGRAGGITKPVIGAHAGGFNTGSVGVAMIGHFSIAPPSDVAVDSVARIIGWKLSLFSSDPFGTTDATSGGNERYPQGTVVNVDNVAGHRDTSSTACPGAYLYSRLDQIRSLARKYFPNIIGSYDGEGIVPGGIRVMGWAIDVNTEQPIAVHAYVDGVGYANMADQPRGDVGSVYPAYGSNHGFDFAVPASTATHQVCLYGINDDPIGFNYPLGCHTVVLNGTPIGSLDGIARAPGGLAVSGWAIDPDTTSADVVHAYVDSAGWPFVANTTRSDVGAVFPGYGHSHGYAIVLAAGYGSHAVCTYGINTAGPGVTRQLGCGAITVDPDPIGSLDSAVAGFGSVHVAGWAIDPDTANAIQIHVYIDGSGFNLGPATLPRPDVGAALPWYGNGHGFNLTLPASPGRHVLCAYGINTAGPGINRQLGCSTIVVG